MKHVQDIMYQGHEIVLLQYGGAYVVDIREDDFDGAFMTGVSDFITRHSAIRYAEGYIDGVHSVRPHEKCPKPAQQPIKIEIKERK